MTKFHLRTDFGQPAPGAGRVLLDWLPGDRRSTVQSGAEFFRGWLPEAVARDLLRLAVATYVCDRIVPRAQAPDSWTRALHLSVPVARARLWASAAEPLRAGLDFLSGDHWQLRFRRDPTDPGVRDPGVLAGDAVCLFSGGLDSLAGAIDLLEAGTRLVLVGHYEGGLAPSRQSGLADALRAEYGADAVQFRQLFLRPGAPNRSQLRPLPRERENTMRARSILFIAAGLAVASALGSAIPLYVPENGYIGINVPLTWSRPASLSTRTTHPYFVERLRAALDGVVIANPLINPYRLMTKGEVLAASRNPALLHRLAPRSLSCAHPETARYARRLLGNCGYCYPCLIRRAALHAIGQDTDHYAYHIDRDLGLIEAGEKGGSLRALIRSLAKPSSTRDVLRNGPIPGGEHAQFAALYDRGRHELRAWLSAVGGDSIRARLR